MSTLKWYHMQGKKKRLDFPFVRKSVTISEFKSANRKLDEKISFAFKGKDVKNVYKNNQK